MNRGSNIFDFLEQRQIPYYVSDPAHTESENLSELIVNIRKEQIDFAFLYWPELDGLLHREGNDSAEVPLKLRTYEHWITDLLAAAENHFHDVHLYVFSDHGMANCDERLDLKAAIDSCRADGTDYVFVYTTTTMARFLFIQ